MALRAWVCFAQSGTVVAELDIAPGASFRSRLAGGVFNAEVPIGHLTTHDGTGPDVEAIKRVLEWCDGGRYTLLITEGRTVIGEWIIWKHSLPSGEGMLPISGFEWDSYPQFRSIFTRYQYENTDMGTVVRDLLLAAITEYQWGTVQITVPTFTSGTRVTIDHRARTGYFGDVLDDLDKIDPGMEWRIVIGADWDGERPVRATRRVVFGAPEIRTPTDLRLVKAPVGERHGNVTEFERSRDYSKAAMAVYGWGAGEGGKQRFVGLGDTESWHEGYLNITKNVNFPGEVSTGQLERKTRKTLAQAQDAWEPTVVSVDYSKLPSIPRVGDVVRCTVGWSWTYPEGFQGTFRVGEVSFQSGTHSMLTLQLA